MAKYKCKVCGYIHEGNKAPDVCPVCAAPASDFEEMKDEAAADKKKGLDRDSNVYTVVYASVMVVLVAVVLAFTSQSLRTFQQKNEENDKRQQILRSINVTVPANEAEAKYSELIKEAFLVNENGEKVEGDAFAADVVKAVALGADACYIGTAALLALGCHLCRTCQSGKCAWGIATQRPELTKRLDPEEGAVRLINLMTAWRHEIMEMMGGMGINSIEALRGNRLMLRGVGLTEKELSILGVFHAGE